MLDIERSAFTQPWLRTTFEGLIDREDADVIAAESGDRLLGYAICWTVLDQAEIGNIAVAPDARRSGIGRLLLDAALARVRERGARECFLEVRESNAAARALYESFGFVVIDRRKRYYTKPVEAAVVMRKEI